MLEEALNNSNTDPSEAALALVTFFRDELPLGGYSANNRFVRLFPILLERVFGPPVQLVPFTESYSIGGSQLGNVSVKEVEALRAAWLNRSQRWSYGLNTGSTRSRPPSGLSVDPVVKLLSFPSESQQQRSNSQLSPPLLLPVLEDADRTMSRKVRLRFPFQALSKEMQLSLCESLLELPRSNGVSTDRRLWELLTIPLMDQTDLRRAVNMLQQQAVSSPYQTQSSPYTSTAMGGRVSPMMIGTPSHSTGRSFASPTPANLTPRGSTTTGGNNRSPTFFSPQGSTPESNSNQKMIMHPFTIQKLTEMNAALMVTMWEYYAITFVNLPIVAGALYIQAKIEKRDQDSSSSSSRRTQLPAVSGDRIPYGEKVYLYLLRANLSRYLPHDFYSTVVANQPSRSRGSNNTQSRMNYDDGQELDDDNEEEQEEDRKQKSDIFLMLMKSMWLEAYHSYPTTKKSLMHITSSTDRSDTQDHTEMNSSFDLASLLPLPSTTAGMTAQVYKPPAKQVQRCLRYLVEHLICDPSLAFNCRRHYRNEKNHAGRNRWQSSIGGIASRVNATNNNNMGPSASLPQSLSNKEWPLPSAHATIQTSLYNYIRTALTHAPVHSPHTAFHRAINLWLMWLEPWNVVQQKRSSHVSKEAAKHFLHTVVGNATKGDSAGSSRSSKSSTKRRQLSAGYVNAWNSPKPTAASKYKAAVWESYVAANLHFYTVPLAIFIKRAREFDFSIAEFQKSIKIVQEVFRVYSPELVRSLEKILKESNCSQNENERSHEWRSVVEKHEHLLNEYCPPCKISQNPWSLEMLQQDMQNLLEEISSQHNNALGEQDFFEKIGSRIEGLFGEGPRRDALMISNLVKRARIIVKFPRNYEIFPSNNKRSRKDGSSGEDSGESSGDNASPERGQFGFLTDQGREQLLHGTRMCNAMDVEFLGDPMYSRVKSYEVEFLVKWTVSLSDRLNSYFGLKASDEAEDDVDDCDDKVLMKLAEEREESKKLRFRFNLRFLADPRNCVAIYIAGMLLRAIIW